MTNNAKLIFYFIFRFKRKKNFLNLNFNIKMQVLKIANSLSLIETT